MQSSVSGSSRPSVSGTPISLLKLRLGRDRPALRRADGGEDVLRRGLARRSGDRDDSRAAALADAPGERRQRREGVLGDERGRRSARERVLDVLDPAAYRDEEVALLDPPRVDLDAGRPRAAPGAACEPPGSELRDLVERERDHAVARSARSASRATSRSSNGTMRPAISWPCSCPLPAITTTSPGRASSIARAIAAGGRARPRFAAHARPAPRRRSPPGPRCAGCRT